MIHFTNLDHSFGHALLSAALSGVDGEQNKQNPRNHRHTIPHQGHTNDPGVRHLSGDRRPTCEATPIESTLNYFMNY